VTHARDFTEEAINETLDGKDLSRLNPDAVEKIFVECVACYLAKVVMSKMGT